MAVVVRDFAARARVAPAERDSFTPPGPGGDQLVAGAVRRFRARFDVRESVEVWSATTVPREVGLGGSSAIVISVLRALSAAHEVQLDAEELAWMALAVEVEECGIAAGIQDRLVQAREALLFVDSSPGGESEELDERLLPDLYVAWLPESAAPSGVVHAELRARHARGDPDVRATMSELAGLASGARDALRAGDGAELARCIDGSLELRRRIVPVDERLMEAAALARAHGASANSAGSGGAIVGTRPDSNGWRELEGALQAAGWRTLAP